MKGQKRLRQLHYWLSIILALPGIVMICAGILLMLKKDIAWIQPPTVASGQAPSLPRISHAQMLANVTALEQIGDLEWQDFTRIDYKPKKGVVKFITSDRWEVQLDTATGALLSVARRRSDVIESLHDGSFFANWAKRYVFLPAGVILLIMWGSGLYLFFLPRVKRARRRRQKLARADRYYEKAW